ncbi:hypothetical protein P7B02_17530 [Caulobacter segnis]|uniref:hypothetical protein n=1 Tax=Caulobacter segnis TaxID=88688 RepID=UPI00240FC97A|nr:hypothetical protein [Caulobacter segnis]MDG2523334.1 hypothetical protein [Caulobacter segnis]
MTDGRTNTITRLADHRPGALPAAPVFFASRLVCEDWQEKVVEYCALDSQGEVKLQVSVTWNAEPLHPGLWTPTASALAAVLLIGQLFDHERVVVAHLLDDEALQPLRVEAREVEIIEMRELLGRRDLRKGTPDLEDQIAMLRFDPGRPDNAYGDALLLKTCWAFVEARLRKAPALLSPPPPPGASSPLSPGQALSLPHRMHVPGWFWGLGAAIAVQLLALSAPWLFPGG